MGPEEWGKKHWPEAPIVATHKLGNTIPKNVKSCYSAWKKIASEIDF